MRHRTVFLLAGACLIAAGCAPLVYQSTALPDVKGARGFSLNAMYGAGKGDISQAREVMGQTAKASCAGAYTLISEQDRPNISPAGDAELIWIVRCES